MLWEHRLSKNKMYSIEKDQPENRLVFFGGTEDVKDEHSSVLVFSPSKASSIASNGILSILKGFLLALIINVKWSSYK